MQPLAYSSSSLPTLSSLLSSETSSSVNSTCGGAATGFLTSLLREALAARRGLNLARPINTASSERIVRLPWKGQMFTLQIKMTKYTHVRRQAQCKGVHIPYDKQPKTHHKSNNFLLCAPGSFSVSSASTHSSIPLGPPKTIRACL
jgi:hypothetical protein